MSYSPSAQRGTTTIALNPEQAAQNIKDQLDRVLKGEPELDALVQTCENFVFSQLSGGAEDSEMVRNALQILLQASHMEAFMQAWEREQVTLPLGRNLETVAHYALPSRAMRAWNTGFFFSLICRSVEMRHQLNFLPYTRHFVNHEVLGEFRLIYYHFLRTLGSDMSQIFYNRAAYALSKIPQDYAEAYKASFPLWQPILDGSEDALREVLRYCLYERKMLLSDQMRREADVALTGILAYAEVQGLRVDEDRYPMPSALVRGDFEVDLRTPLSGSFLAEARMAQVG